MSEVWGAERPVIGAEEAERWAKRKRLRFPEQVAEEIDAWQRADGRFDEQLAEFDEFFEPVFDGFEEFDRDMRSDEIGFIDGSTGLVATAQGWAERRGPYSEWVLAVRQLEDGTFIGLGGPPAALPTWRFRRVLLHADMVRHGRRDEGANE